MAAVGARRVVRLANGVVLSADSGPPDAQGNLGGCGSIYVDTVTGRRYSLGGDVCWDYDHYQNLHSLSGFMDDAITNNAVDHARSYSGQVKAYVTNMSVTGLVAEVAKNFDPAEPDFTLVEWPCTTWPINVVTPALEDVLDCVTPRIKENPILGQMHTWRFNGEYSGKARNNAGAMDFELYNPDSGFYTQMEIVLPQGRTSGLFGGAMVTIADTHSIGAGKGYRLRVRSSFSDANLVVQVNDILRISHAVENHR